MIYFLLIAINLIAFGRSFNYPYIVLDDHYYLSENARITAGLTWENIRWAFTTFQTGDWQPLTWLSWIVPAQFFGLNPTVSHSINIFLHIANTLLLFVVLKKYTGAVWRSAIVAALFAIHPMRVESVVWAAERKDVLAGLFWMLSLCAYYHYAKKPSPSKMLWISLLLLSGVMAKPILIVLPILFLLLDYWPLKRFETVNRTWLWVEKIPFFLISFFSCIMTFLAACVYMMDVEKAPFHLRVINAVLSYGDYVKKTFWPYPLAHFYPHPMEDYSRLGLAVSVFLLAGITFLVFRWHRKIPAMLVGWLWFLIVLFPMAGLIQVGKAGMADRYTYFPHIGFFIMAVWFFSEIKSRRFKFLLSSLVIVSFCLLSFMQTGYWRDSAILDRHTLAVTGHNPIAQGNLQYAVLDKGIKTSDVDSLMNFLAESSGVEIPSKSN